MKIDVLARSWGSPAGGSNGMAIAAAFFAATLEQLGHVVRRAPAIIDGAADLVITTLSQTWHRTTMQAVDKGLGARLVYWHHAGGVPFGLGHVLAAPPAIGPQPGWSRHVVLPPSSWAAEAGGEATGHEIVVAGAGPAKGGHIALEVARRLPSLRWLVLQGRSSSADQAPWRALPNAEVASGVVAPEHFLARARAILAPTRFDVHPLLLVEAAVRGIPIVCSDLPGTRAAAGDCATYVSMTSAAQGWALALLDALERPAKRLQLRPYADVVRGALDELQGGGSVAA
jgi:glycosyltransferase involved in cell wall biosynthesis